MCKAKLPGEAYRSRATGAVLCPEHFAEVAPEKHAYFQRLERPPRFKSSSKCLTCQTKVWGERCYLTPLGGVFCEEHVQQFGPEGVKMCHVIDAATMDAWKHATKDRRRLDQWRYVDDGVHAVRQRHNR